MPPLLAAPQILDPELVWLAEMEAMEVHRHFLRPHTAECPADACDQNHVKYMRRSVSCMLIILRESLNGVSQGSTKTAFAERSGPTVKI